MAAKKKKKAKKATRAVTARKSPSKKTASKKAKKAPAKKKSKARTAAKKPAAKKAPAKKTAPRKAVKKTKKKKQIVGEGDYAASRTFLKDQSGFVKKNKAEIPAMAKSAEAALEGPEGDALRAAEAEGRSHSKAGSEE